MTQAVWDRLQRAYRKNKSEAAAWLTGRMPSFLYGVKKFRDLPVFCFHSARYPEFEHQLRFLKQNGYKTLTADELWQRLSDPRYENDGTEIALTFDDGMASVWTVAFPLLQKYEFKIISFVLPGLVEEGDRCRETIEDVEASERQWVAQQDHGERPLCNWKEIERMHESGLVDVQSHGLHHALVAVSPRIVDFIHPRFDTYHYGNIHVPLYRDPSGRDRRDPILGHPVYQHAPRLSVTARYLDPYALREACAGYVERHGGPAFFERRDWRRQLNEVARRFFQEHPEQRRHYESESEARHEIQTELEQSRREIERRLGKGVTHFCFPWFSANEQSAALALQAGYEAIHLGATPGYRKASGRSYPLEITRVQEEYLLRLPGEGRLSWPGVLKHKLGGQHAGH